MESNRQSYPSWGEGLPILDTGPAQTLCATPRDGLQLALPKLLSGIHSMELLERERCLADLAGWLRAAAERGGCIALVAGEAGIGKTTLVQEFSKQQSETRVLWGACDALFTPRPLAPLHDIARQTKGALLTAVSSGANRDQIFTTALDELEREKALVVFEDMHWADEATLDLLKYLGRRVHRTQAMLAVTYRDDEVGPRHPLRYVIGDLPRASVHRMVLAPLSESAVAQLARRAERPSKGLHILTGGNPLFVTEVLAAAADTVPATVRDAVLARAVRLPQVAREIAELVCVVPGKTEIWLLEQAARLDEAGIEGCLSIGMVRHEDGSLAYRHELVRRAFGDSLSQPRLRSLHEKVLAILETRPNIPPARLAHHASCAQDADAVRRFAPQAAAQAASVGAHREAASHFEAVVPYADDFAPADRARLLEQLSYECFLIGSYARASEARRVALEIWRGIGACTQEGDALRSLSRLAWFEGRRADADRYSADAIRVLESLPPSPVLAEAYCDRADLDMESHENHSAIDFAHRAIALAEAWTDHLILSNASNVLGTARLIIGDDSGWADLERSLQLALANSFQEQAARAYNNLSAMAVSRRRYDEAARYLSAGLGYCEERDLDFLRPYMLAYRARMKFEQGHWLEAGDDVEAVLRHPRTTPITRIPALRTLGHLRIRRGDPDADSPLEEARALAGPQPELQRFGTLAAIAAEAAWLAGDWDGVLREVQPAYEMVLQRRDPRMKGELAVWLWRVDAIEQPPTDIPEPYALELSRDWRGAARAWTALGCPYERALVLGWYGTEPEQREALAILDQLGAAPAAQALRRRMRTRGVRAVPRGSRTSTRRNSLGLTRREAQILALVSDGLRNAAIARRLFVSTKTVDHHVSAILAKLRVPSRAEAVTMARNAQHKGLTILE
jgi:DNA-binding CsgD family transcriptional regulator/tetratricopeptide (TPR) repeat protein